MAHYLNVCAHSLYSPSIWIQICFGSSTNNDDDAGDKIDESVFKPASFLIILNLFLQVNRVPHLGVRQSIFQK